MKKVVIFSALIAILGLVFWGCGDPSDFARTSKQSVGIDATHVLSKTVTQDLFADQTINVGVLSLDSAPVRSPQRLFKGVSWPKLVVLPFGRWLNEDAIKPWQYRSWIFPRDPQFETERRQSN
jgi:hypothetical protein